MDGGLLEYILGNTDAEVNARDKYEADLRKEIRERREAELRKRLADSIGFRGKLGS